MPNDETAQKLDKPQLEPPMPSSGMEWGLPLGLAAAAVVLTLVFYNAQHGGTTSGTRTTAAVQQGNAPAQAR
jgi:hypothetical protein